MGQQPLASKTNISDSPAWGSAQSCFPGTSHSQLPASTAELGLKERPSCRAEAICTEPGKLAFQAVCLVCIKEANPAQDSSKQSAISNTIFLRASQVEMRVLIHFVTRTSGLLDNFHWVNFIVMGKLLPVRDPRPLFQGNPLR